MKKEQAAEIKQSYRITSLSDKLDEIKDYAHAGRVGNQAVSYDAIERLAWEAINILADIRGAAHDSSCTKLAS